MEMKYQYTTVNVFINFLYNIRTDTDIIILYTLCVCVGAQDVVP